MRQVQQRQTVHELFLDDLGKSVTIQFVLMRAILALGDDLVRIAQELTGTKQNVVLIREALKALIERESARRLSRLGRTMSGLTTVPRRRLKLN